MGRLTFLAILLAASVASAQDAAPAAPTVAAAPVRVAVVPGIAVNLDTARVDALSQELADALAAELVVEATGGLEVRRQLPPDGVAPDCVTTPACVADVAQRTGANQLLFVVMVDSGAGGSIQVDTTWVDPVANKSVSRPAIDLTNANEARARFAAAARQLLPDAPVRPKPVTGGNTVVVQPQMTEGVPRHFTTPAKITAAVGVVGLGAGIALGLSARSKYNDCDANPFTCTESRRDSIENTALLADIGFVVAAGAAVATVVLYVTSSEEPRLIVSPTPDGAAAVFVGRF